MALQDRLPTASRKQHICVVEDDAAVLDSLRCMLERNGYAVRSFGSPDEFLRSHEFDRYACLILDLKLPGMSGLELLELLRTRAYTKPVVLIGATRETQLEPRRRNVGVDKLLLKPLNSGTLLKALRQAIGNNVAQSEPLRT